MDNMVAFQGFFLVCKGQGPSACLMQPLHSVDGEENMPSSNTETTGGECDFLAPCLSDEVFAKVSWWHIHSTRLSRGLSVTMNRFSAEGGNCSCCCRDCSAFLLRGVGPVVDANPKIATKQHSEDSTNNIERTLTVQIAKLTGPSH